MLALVQEQQRKNISRGVRQRCAVDVHVSRSSELFVAKRVEVLVEAAADALAVSFGVGPRVHRLDREVARARWGGGPAVVTPVSVRQRIPQGRPAGARNRFDECVAAERADGGFVLSPGVIGEGEELFDCGAVHADGLYEIFETL